MITVLNCNIDGFLKTIRGKRVFCFGSGKYFRLFTEHHPDITVCGVIDNYRQEGDFSVGGSSYKIYSMEDFCNTYCGGCVLVITIRFFEEVVDQLNAAEKLDGIPCFFPFVVEDYFNIGEVQKHMMKSQIEKLSKSFYTNEKINYEKKIRGGYYQIWEYIGRTNIGGDKARTDISDMLTEQGYQTIKVHCSGRANVSLSMHQMWEDWESLFESIEENAIVCMQHPIPAKIELPESIWHKMKKEKHIRFIIIVHEVESLRKTYYELYREKEFKNILEVGDVFIVHNEVMKQFFIEQGINAERIISLDIFDYLDSETNVKKSFEKSVTIAANLHLKKSPYLLHLKELEDLKIHLYGPNYTEDIIVGSKNIIYHGSLPTEIIPQKLDRGFGLVWDGNSVETCSGGTGEYLRYNNPHKLSLYLSAGLPVIIWSQAAEAQFVIKNGVGFCVDSLMEIDARMEEIQEEQYMEYVQKSEEISQKLKKGYYFKYALKKAEEILCPKYL